jgi:hypothetical protein
MDNALCDYSPLPARPKLTWPKGARVAFYIGLNIEHYQVDKPSTSIFGGTAALVPDPLNYGWRDYAVRVGIRLHSSNKRGHRGSARPNWFAEVRRHERYPQDLSILTGSEVHRRSGFGSRFAFGT